MASRKYIIYLTTNLLNGVVYKGVHLNRKSDPYEFDGYLGSGIDIKEAIKEFGRSNFKRETLFVLDTKEEAKNKERELVTPEFVKLDTNYNRTIGGGDWPVLVGANNPNYGKVFSVETRTKISKANKGRIVPEKICKKISNSHKGVKLSKGHCKKISEGLQNYYASPKGDITREKMRKISKGKKHTKETCEKISKNHVGFDGKYHTEESCKKISESNKGKNTLLLGVIKQRQLDIMEEPKTYGWKTRLAKKWNIDNSTVTAFIKKYASDLDLPFNKIIECRRLDIKNIPKVWGWKTRLSKKWNINSGCVNYFIKKYALDLI